MAHFLSHTPAARLAAKRFVTNLPQITPQGLNNYSGEMTRWNCESVKQSREPSDHAPDEPPLVVNIAISAVVPAIGIYYERQVPARISARSTPRSMTGNLRDIRALRGDA